MRDVRNSTQINSTARITLRAWWCLQDITTRHKTQDKTRQRQKFEIKGNFELSFGFKIF